MRYSFCINLCKHFRKASKWIFVWILEMCVSVTEADTYLDVSPTIWYIKIHMMRISIRYESPLLWCSAIWHYEKWCYAIQYSTESRILFLKRTANNKLTKKSAIITSHICFSCTAVSITFMLLLFDLWINTFHKQPLTQVLCIIVFSASSLQLLSNSLIIFLRNNKSRARVYGAPVSCSMLACLRNSLERRNRSK